MSLEDMEGISLLNRQDSKYAFNQALLGEVLERAAAHYRILDTDASRLIRYQNRYFDTPDFALFSDHHNGKRPRYKFRYRRYVQSDLCFFERKFKNNKGRTLKKRVVVQGISDGLEQPGIAELLERTPYRSGQLQPVLDLDFQRFTLASHAMNDRCTIDTGLSIRRGNRSVHFPELVICEIKQSRFSRDNALVRALESLHIAPLSLSKYCLGLLYLQPGVRYNRFKEKTLHLQRLTTIAHA
jgi:hypothetical protein